MRSTWFSAAVFAALAAPMVAALPPLPSQHAFAAAPIPPASFFAGRYAVIGQRSADAAPYAGTAVIEALDDMRFVLEVTVDGVTTREQGRIEVLSPLADATVLNLFDGSGIIAASCLWTVDLDNYARLTCLRSPATAGGDAGREAYFPLH